MNWTTPLTGALERVEEFRTGSGSNRVKLPVWTGLLHLVDRAMCYNESRTRSLQLPVLYSSTQLSTLIVITCGV